VGRLCDWGFARSGDALGLKWLRLGLFLLAGLWFLGSSWWVGLILLLSSLLGGLYLEFGSASFLREGVGFLSKDVIRVDQHLAP
jgi:hypothetical protein